MKAIITLDVPEWQIGQDVAVYFPDTMIKHGKCELLKEQEKLVDVDALREKLGLAKDCAKCKQNTRACQYDSHFSLMDFCERLDMAIDELKQVT